MICCERKLLPRLASCVLMMFSAAEAETLTTSVTCPISSEMLTVTRLRLPKQLRRALACTNAIENMQGTIRRVSRNVKRWHDADMALRWAAAGMMEAAKGFRRLKAYKQLPRLRDALAEHAKKHAPATRSAAAVAAEQKAA